MGYGRELPWFLVVALCAALPVFVAVRSYVAATTPVVYIIGSMMALALGLFVVAWVAVRHAAITRRDMRRLAAEITTMIRESREERRIAADLAAQVSVLRAESENFANALSVEMNDVRQGHAAMANDMRTFLERQYLYQNQMQQNQQQRRPVVVHPSQWAPGEGAIESDHEVPALLPPRAGSLDATPLADSIVISLEPVIDLFSGKTAHYRLHYAIEGGDASGAERSDQRPGLDIHLYRESLVLLKRLRKRDSHLNILVPVGAATLASPEALSRLAQLHASEPGVSEGLVVDLPHAVLASLPQSSLEGLAYMARAGIDMSLSNAAVAGLDLAALDKLNVRFVGLSAGSVGAEPKQSAGITNFVQAARALHVQVIVTGVANAQQATQLMRVARFASGPAFAEPRRVRRDATGQGAEELSAAAE